MKILIADDEKLARDRLRSLVTDLELGNVIGEADNGQSVLEQTEQLRPDVILLDIRMPGMNGLETAMHLDQFESPPAVIFTTAYDEYALQAFEAHAIDYLLKPVRRERLTSAIQSVKRLSRLQLTGLQQQTGHETASHISARTHGGIKLVAIATIKYFQAADKYITVYYDEGSVLIEESLKSLEERLGELFIRVHRNALVAKRLIIALEKDDQGQCQVRLQGVDESIEVSRRHSAEVRQLLKQQAG
ncbi:MAG: LytTR family DNA-binding domain-containing protein [Gammaproteobacteria bacterium]|nr:LytTR family DNA-binding domain-containing protein [Gammaproteobacteria bacterium]